MSSSTTEIQEDEKLKTFKASKSGTTKVLGILMLIIVTIASGFIFLNFVTGNIDSMKTTFNTQMKSLLLDHFSVNQTHVVIFLKNTADEIIEITKAYVNHMLAILHEGKAIIAPLTTGIATIIGSFTPGNTYEVKLTSFFSIDISFTVTA